MHVTQVNYEQKKFRFRKDIYRGEFGTPLILSRRLFHNLLSPSKIRPTERFRSYVQVMHEAQVSVQQSAFRWHYRGKAEY